jgi:3-O-alpha-D-mannopyranosyl-alpha-D-mannopyranose xylosylphosphotransferase
MIEANPRISILGLNDDIDEDYEETRNVMNSWFDFGWPRKPVWERGWDVTVDME